MHISTCCRTFLPYAATELPHRRQAACMLICQEGIAEGRSCITRGYGDCQNVLPSSVFDEPSRNPAAQRSLPVQGRRPHPEDDGSKGQHDRHCHDGVDHPHNRRVGQPVLPRSAFRLMPAAAAAAPLGPAAGAGRRRGLQCRPSICHGREEGEGPCKARALVCRPRCRKVHCQPEGGLQRRQGTEAVPAGGLQKAAPSSHTCERKERSAGSS